MLCDRKLTVLLKMVKGPFDTSKPVLNNECRLFEQGVDCLVFWREWLEDLEVNTSALLLKPCEPDEVSKHVRTT